MPSLGGAFAGGWDGAAYVRLRAEMQRLQALSRRRCEHLRTIERLMPPMTPAGRSESSSALTDGNADEQRPAQEDVAAAALGGGGGWRAPPPKRGLRRGEFVALLVGAFGRHRRFARTLEAPRAFALPVLSALVV